MATLYHDRLAWFNVNMRIGKELGAEGQTHGGVANDLPSLSAESRARARARILQAAMVELASRGVDVTIDEIASTAGVSRRTVFRHYATHGQLLAAASSEIWRSFEAQIPEPPLPDEDVDDWLIRAAVTLHELNRRVLGQAFWGLSGPEPGGHAELSQWRRELFDRRSHRINHFSAIAWRAYGGLDHPPQWVVDACALMLSSFASNGLGIEGPRPPDETGRVCARILSSVLRSAVEEGGPRAEGVTGKGTDTVCSRVS